MARSTKFTQQTIDGLLDALSHGATFKGACAEVGIVFETFRKWREKGEKIASGEIRKTKSNAKFEQFYYEVEKAIQSSFTKARRIILEAGKDDWRAADAYLKGRDPEWGKDSNVNLNVKNDVIKVTLTGDD